MSILQKISQIEDEIARTQKNKATNYHIGLLKAKLARLKQQLIETDSKNSGGGEEGFDVAKAGDIRVAFIGFPSVGKSTLLNKLTGQFSEVAEYEFTTLTCVPGILHYKGATIQLLDLPGIIEGARDGKGRGKQVIAVARTCNLILIILDATKPLTTKKIIEKELEGFGIRINKQPPNITITKKDKGGITITSVQPLENLTEELIRTICHEYRLMNCSISFKCQPTVDEFIDAVEGNRVYVPALFVLNKSDQITYEELEILGQLPNSCMISAQADWNISGLLEQMWDRLDLIRIYTKPKGQLPDFNEPVILRRSKATVLQFCNKIHKQLAELFKYALVWGTSVKHTPQKVGKEHELADEDVVQICKS